MSEPNFTVELFQNESLPARGRDVNAIVTVTPEFADVARIAREKSLPVREVLDQARADGRRLLGE